MNSDLSDHRYSPHTSVFRPYSLKNSGVAKGDYQPMVHDSILSPHRRSQTAFSSPSFRKQFQAREELGSCSTLIQRHRFLLTALVLLAFLCTIYLYFAVTLGSTRSCSGLTGSERTSCA
ncbi:hypothetical protein CK203_111711 [Vitis vinifera]|uniref:Uncharacterized protein n=1 Tax=Vitis vinifera TaxID=29760 RepID=A0A438EMY1_VITVI|nr:hypothetical protein CK203_111711 [Vitis vinifera]